MGDRVKNVRKDQRGIAGMWFAFIFAAAIVLGSGTTLSFMPTKLSAVPLQVGDETWNVERVDRDGWTDEMALELGTYRTIEGVSFKIIYDWGDQLFKLIEGRESVQASGRLGETLTGNNIAVQLLGWYKNSRTLGSGPIYLKAKVKVLSQPLVKPLSVSGWGRALKMVPLVITQQRIGWFSEVDVGRYIYFDIKRATWDVTQTPGVYNYTFEYEIGYGTADGETYPYSRSYPKMTWLSKDLTVELKAIRTRDSREYSFSRDFTTSASGKTIGTFTVSNWSVDFNKIEFSVSMAGAYHPEAGVGWATASVTGYCDIQDGVAYVATSGTGSSTPTTVTVGGIDSGTSTSVANTGSTAQADFQEAMRQLAENQKQAITALVNSMQSMENARFKALENALTSLGANQKIISDGITTLRESLSDLSTYIQNANAWMMGRIAANAVKATAVIAPPPIIIPGVANQMMVQPVACTITSFKISDMSGVIYEHPGDITSMTWIQFTPKMGTTVQVIYTATATRTAENQLPMTSSGTEQFTESQQYLVMHSTVGEDISDVTNEELPFQMTNMDLFFIIVGIFVAIGLVLGIYSWRKK